MKIFLTGASGFVGSFFLRKILYSQDNEVALLLRAPKKSWRIADLLDSTQIIEGDLRNPNSYKQALLDFQPNIIIHLAWVGVGGASRNDIGQWRNVGDTLELIELASHAGAHTFIGLGSQAEYGPACNVIDEAFQVNPTTVYGAAKLAACQLGGCVALKLGMRFSWLRLFSSYGPMDEPYWLLPYLINTMLSGGVPKLTACEQKWDYVYVDDVADAIYAVMRTEQASGVFNLGSGSAPSLKKIVEIVKDYVNADLDLIYGQVPYREDQVMHLQANIDRLSAVTGWTPKTGLNEGLLSTVNWWKNEQEPLTNNQNIVGN